MFALLIVVVVVSAIVVQIGSKCSITEIHVYYKPTDNHVPGSHLTHTSVNLNPPVSTLLSLIHQL